MSNIIGQLGDNTTHDVKPDFDSGKGYYWMKQVKAIQEQGSNVPIPRKPRKSLAERSFFDQVDKRLSRKSFTIGVRFDKAGKRIPE